MTVAGAALVHREGALDVARDPLVRLDGISKRFGHLLANDRVSFAIPRGQVVGLLGENGAGKTTAMNVLAGLYLPDAGEITVEGRRLALGSPRASVAAGIGMVHQQFKLVPTLSGFENVSLAVHRGRFWQPPGGDPTVVRLVEELGFDLDLSLAVWQLPLGRRQQLEILRTLAIGAKVLILDEPTSVLSPIEAQRLFAILRRIATTGRAVVLISHKLSEVLTVADHVVVMRAGRVVHEGRSEDVDAAELARLIVGGGRIADGGRPRSGPGPPVLVVRHLRVTGDHGALAVRDASFEVRAGELVALVGVTGNGQSELIEAIAGLRPTVSGSVVAPAACGRRGFAYVPAQHLGTGLAPDLSIAENAILGHHRAPPFGPWLDRALVAARAEAVVERLGVAAPITCPTRRLSGGNLQRIVLGRELLGDPPLIVAEYPTRGLDVAAAAQIRAALAARVEAGAAVLMASEELEESLAIANRILVMHGGTIVADLAAEEADLERIARLITTGRA